MSVSRNIGRRALLRLSVLTAGTLLVAACGQPSPSAPASAPAAPTTAGSTPPTAAPTVGASPVGLGSPPAATPATAHPTAVATPTMSAGNAGGTAVIAHYAMNGDLDPGRTPGFDAWMPLQNVCEALVRIKAQSNGTLAIEPVLAESYDKSADGTVYTFKLRPGVKFHDGTPFDAQAVLFTHDRLMNPQNKFYNEAFVGFKDALNAIIAKVEAVDDSTVRFTLKSPPNPYFLNWEAFTRIVSPAAVERYGKDFGSHIVGTGPFKLDRFDFAGKTIEMSRNPDYWVPGLPKLDHLTWKATPEPATRLAQLATGAADVATIMPPEYANQIRSNPQLDLNVAQVPLFNEIEFYQTVPPFDDVKLRQAVAYALDRKALAQVLYSGTWAPAINDRWPGMTGWADYQPYPYNPAKAKSLLAEAGHASGLTFTLDLPSSSSGNPAGQRWGEAIQSQLAKTGINVKLNIMDSASFWQLLYKPRAGTAHYMTRQVFVGDVVNEWLLTWIKPQPYADKPVAGLPELYAQLLKATTPDAYNALVQKIWTVIDDQIPYIAIADGSWLTGLRKALTGLQPQGLGEYLAFANASLEGQSG